MDLKILGCGTIIPREQCSPCSGYLIDNELLIDCGPGIWHALCRNNLNISGLDYILLSHFHIDHCSDLAPILLTRYLSASNIKRPLIIGGPKGLNEWFARLVKICGKWVYELAIDLVEIDEETHMAECKIEALPTRHTETSLCYRITSKKNARLFYSGDSDYNKNIILLANKCDVAIVEASNLTRNKVEGHLTPELAAEIAQKAAIKCLVLTHMYPEVEALAAKQTAAKIFEGTIKIAKPGINIKVG
jgi:ribonuclease BN (tRNA processing enzyme)